MKEPVAWKTPSRWLGRLWVTGPDRTSFLQGQSTPDLRRLEPGSVVFGAFLDPKGRVLANGWFAIADEAILLILADALIEPMMAHLQRYILRAKVSLDRRADEQPLWLTESTDAGGSSETPDQPFRQNEGGWRVHFPKGLVLTESARNGSSDGSVPLGGEMEALLLVRHGIPLVTPNTQAEFLPQMLALERFGGISYDKGCYTGQEIVTRSHFLGRVKRHLMRVHSDLTGDWPPGTALIDCDSKDSAGTLLLGATHPNGGFSGLACLKEGIDQVHTPCDGTRIHPDILKVSEL